MSRTAHHAISLLCSLTVVSRVLQGADALALGINNLGQSGPGFNVPGLNNLGGILGGGSGGGSGGFGGLGGLGRPNNPLDPNNPFGPNGPFGPNNPLGPSNPLDPNGPFGPIDPLDPNGPFGPNDPFGPNGPFGPNDPFGPNGPFGPNDPFGPTGGHYGPFDDIDLDDLIPSNGDDGGIDFGIGPIDLGDGTTGIGFEISIPLRRRLLG